METTNEIAATCTADVPAPRTVPFFGLWVWTLLGSILFGASGHMLMKFGVVNIATHGGWSISHLFSTASLPLLAGLSIYLLGTVFWMLTVSRKEISYLYPLTSMTYVLVAVGGYFLFHESVSLMHWLGLAVIVCGVTIMQVSSRVD
jgi:multidrug transporter EmrE-like cation transporter